MQGGVTIGKQNITGAYTFKGAGDTKFTSLANNNVAKYNTTTKKWENGFVNWTELGDTPSSLVANAVPHVNGSATSILLDNELTFDGTTFAVTGNQTITSDADAIDLDITGHSTKNNEYLRIRSNAGAAVFKVDENGRVGINEANPEAWQHMYVNTSRDALWIEEVFGSFTGKAIRYGTAANDIFSVDRNACMEVEPAPALSSLNYGINFSQTNWSMTSVYSPAVDPAFMYVATTQTGTAARTYSIFEAKCTIQGGSVPSGTGRIAHGGRFKVVNANTSSNATAIGGRFELEQNNTGTWEKMRAGVFSFSGGSSGTGNITELVMGDFDCALNKASATTGYGMRSKAWTNSTGAVTTLYGLYLEEQTIGTTNWQIYSVSCGS